MRWAALLLVGIAGLALCGAASAQQRDGSSVLPAASAASKPSGAAEASSSGGGIVFKAVAREVMLQATVVDRHQRPVTTLGRHAFRVFEDGKPQRIISFRREDIPVALAILIDDSGSMRKKRKAVNDAALNLVRASNPQDEVCVINFADRAYLDQDFTGDVALLRRALAHIESRGGTSLYDSLAAAAAHLRKDARLERKVILVVTDGKDTASKLTLGQAVRSIAVEGGPTVYAIGLMGGRKEKTARRALKVLAAQTGGVAYFPSSLEAVNSVTQAIAKELRNQYIISYRPSDAGSAGQYRRVRVEAKAHGYKGLMVRTRSGYFISAAGTASPAH